MAKQRSAEVRIGKAKVLIKTSPCASPPARGGSVSPSGGHYAGCKWTDPPLPSTLPPPPQHWMQQPSHHHHMVMPIPIRASNNIEQHLKILLKVQA